MHHLYLRYPNKRLVALGVSFLLFSTGVLLGNDEISDFEDFQHVVRTANPKLAKETFKRNHPHPPTKEEVGKMVATITQAALVVMDQSREFEKQYPQSARLAEVHRSLSETLSTVFGSVGLPVPQNRARDVETCTRKLLLNAPDDIPLHLVLCRVAASLPKTQQFALYEELSREPTPGPARLMAKDALQKLQRVGVPLDLSFTALDGRKVSLADLKGKVVLIDFWSTTCLPCLREMPELKKLYGKYKSQGLEIVGINLDSNQKVLQRFIQKEEISWPQYFDPAGPTNRLAQEFGIRAIPVVWLVDRHGLLRYLNTSADREGQIEALLSER